MSTTEEFHGDSDHVSAHHGPPPPPEPKTPMWLPAVGAVLFLTVGLLWGLMPASKEPAPAAPPSSAAADAGAAPSPH